MKGKSNPISNVNMLCYGLQLYKTRLANTRGGVP